METRRLIENRIEQYRAIILGSLDRSSHERYRKQIRAEAAKLDGLYRAETEKDRNRMLS
jgi:hypothetical protein